MLSKIRGNTGPVSHLPSNVFSTWTIKNIRHLRKIVYITAHGYIANIHIIGSYLHHVYGKALWYAAKLIQRVIFVVAARMIIQAI